MLCWCVVVYVFVGLVVGLLIGVVLYVGWVVFGCVLVFVVCVDVVYVVYVVDCEYLVEVGVVDFVCFVVWLLVCIGWLVCVLLFDEYGYVLLGGWLLFGDVGLVV